MQIQNPPSPLFQRGKFKNLNSLFWLSILLLFTIPINATESSSIIKITIDGAIIPTTSEYVQQAIKYAENSKAQALIIEIDTPGGLLEATRQIVQNILSAPIPIISYVHPRGARAGSAGVFIVLASDIAAMAPATNIGAAHPVSIMGGDIEGHLAKKIENDTVAWARSLALEHKRNADWAEKAVRESVSITDKEAANKRVVDFVTDNIESLVKKVDGYVFTFKGKPHQITIKETQILSFDMSARQKFVTWLSDPNLLYVLMLIGFLGIIIEFQFPGLIFPALLGILCLAVVFGVQVLPVNGLGVILIIGALLLIIAEVYIVSFGILTLVGLSLLILGSFLLFDVPGSTLQVDAMVIWIFSLLFLALAMLFGFLLLRIQRQAPSSNVAAIVGQHGVVFERIGENAPGTVQVYGAFWSAKADEEIEVDSQIIVVRVEGTRLHVRKAGKE